MVDDFKISKVEYLSNHWLDLCKIINLSLGDQTGSENWRNEMEYDLENIKNGISQQPLIGSFSNYKPKFRGPNIKSKLFEMKMTSNERWPPYIASDKS